MSDERLSDHVTRFLSNMQFGPNTQATYGCALEAFTRFMSKQHGKAIPTLTLDLLDEDCMVGFHRWMLSPRGCGYSPRTVTTYMAALRRFLVWLDAEDKLPLGLRLSKAQHRLAVQIGRRGGRSGYHRRPVDERIPEIVTYYDQLPLPENTSMTEKRARLLVLRARALVHILYASGGRVSEIVNLTREQVQAGRVDELHVTGKGDVERVILLTPEAQDAIAAYLAEREDALPYLFVSHGQRQKGHITRGTAWGIVKKAVRALGLYEGTSPHSFRHYRATQLLNDGLPLELVQAYLGHADIGTTRKVYAVTNTAVLKEEVARHSKPAQEAIFASRAPSNDVA